MSRDLSKKDLYEGVKTLVERRDSPHIHLSQHKLFSLFSIGFQYLLYKASKAPGNYIIRIENSSLADKLAKRSKDPSTRRFITSMLLPRKLKYNNSTFYLDFFHIGSWNMTKDLAMENIKGALIVKTTSSKPMEDISVPFQELETESEEKPEVQDLPQNYFLTSLQSSVPETIIVAYENQFENVQKINFPFIKKDAQKILGGVKISENLDWDNFED